MLNCFYWYSGIWIAVLFFYSLRWSEFNSELSLWLTIFFIFSITFSLVFGYINRKRFKFIKIKTYPKNTMKVTVFTIGLMFLNYLVGGQIPLIATLIKGSPTYLSFSGIKMILPFTVTFSLFWSQYLFYLSLCFPEKRKKLLTEYILVFILCYLFKYDRNAMTNCILMSTLMLAASKAESLQGKKLKSKIKITLLLLSVGLIVTFLFGCLGNIRHGFSWNDSSYIAYYGKFNNYPSWLPNQYMWVYSYITTPLNNLNYNVINKTNTFSILSFIASIIPEFISKRLLPGKVIDCKLVVEYFNVSTGYASSYMALGVSGIYAYFLILFLSLAFLLNYVKPKNRFRMPYLAIMCSMVIFVFFSNTLGGSGFMLPIIYPILSKFKFNYGDKYIDQLAVQLNVKNENVGGTL